MKHGLLGGGIAWLLFMGTARGGDAPAQDAPGAPQSAEAPTGPGGGGPKEQAKSPTELQEALDRNAQAIKALKEEYAREMERQKKLAELQQQQIEVLERTTRLLAEQLKKQGGSTAAVEDVEAKTEALDNRMQQAARRDAELAGATDDLREQVDSLQRNGTKLPSTLKELFLPTQPNETPLAIYGQLLGGYSRQNYQAGLWQSPSIGPWFLLQLNKRFLFSANFDISTSGIGLVQAQLDWYLNNFLTLTAGRFLTPIGSFNERLSPEWINKLPDIPIMFRQVVPQSSTDGVQLRGAHYLGALPVKLEYSFYAGNGFQLAQAATALTPVADLEGLTGGPDEVNARAYGTRIGMWLPLIGVNFGFSGYTNGIFSPGTRNNYNVWDFDFNYHRGNWDFRAEFASNHQQSVPIIGHNISRQGLYAQIAYRNYQAQNRYLANLEGVFRYGFATFSGINPKALDMTVFPTPYDVPVSRDQYTLGINYYFYPSMVLKLAYELNKERTFNLRDDIFLAQGVWAF